MNKYEKLTAEFEDEVIIEERPIKNIGLYSGGIVWLRDDMTTVKVLYFSRRDRASFHYFRKYTGSDSSGQSEAGTQSQKMGI